MEMEIFYTPFSIWVSRLESSICKGIVVFLCSKNQVITDYRDKMQSDQKYNSCYIKKYLLFIPLKHSLDSFL